MPCVPRLVRHLLVPALLLAALPAPAQTQFDTPPIVPLDLTQSLLPPEDPNLPEQTQRFSNATYIGRFMLDAAGRVTGTLTIAWDNGDRYQGRMIDGQRQGQGRFEWANGQRYEGEWRDDQPNGLGKFRFTNGDTYDGEMKNGVPDGFGTKSFFASGSRYEGTFVNGTIDGSGVFTEKSGNHYDGQWQLGHKSGQGSYHWSNGQSYEGDWVDDVATGRGVIVFPNGDRYTGEVLAGRPHGKGSLTYAATQDRYDGEFRDGQSDGQGTYLWKNGDRYEGQWQAGRKSGTGRYTWPDGDYWEGTYADDHQMDGRLYFSPHLDVDRDAASRLLQQTRAVITDKTAARTPDRAVDVARLSAIPLVALELRACSTPDAAADCQARVLREIEDGTHFEHDWQAMFSAKDGTATTRYEVDRRSISEVGRVFSWLRFVDTTTGNSRDTGIKYDCQSQALEIQLLYRCTQEANATSCSLDHNFDKYVGKSLPAAQIQGWFSRACTH